MHDTFYIPIYLDLLATFVFALTGATGAIQRKFDYIGVLMIALLSGVGGSILRDGVFLQQVPLVIRDARYLPVIVLACFAAILFTRLRRGIQMTLVLIDAFGLGAYAVIGTQASTDAGIPVLGALLVGMLNAVGGSMLRDISIRETPMVFLPTEHYAGAALAGGAVFLGLVAAGAHRGVAGSVAIALTILIRMLSVYFGWRTRPIENAGWMQR